MKFQLTPVPYSLATSDNFMTKTDKSAALHHLTKNTESIIDAPSDEDTLTIIDGNAVFHSITQVHTTFRQICVKVLEMMPKKSSFVFSTDMYLDGSIKSMERQRRGTGEKINLSCLEKPQRDPEIGLDFCQTTRTKPRWSRSFFRSGAATAKHQS